MINDKLQCRLATNVEVALHYSKFNVEAATKVVETVNIWQSYRQHGWSFYILFFLFFEGLWLTDEEFATELEHDPKQLLSTDVALF